MNYRLTCRTSKVNPEMSESDDFHTRMTQWATEGLSLELAQTRTVAFGLPIYERPHPAREAALANVSVLLTRLGIQTAVIPAIRMPIHQARNGIVRAFMETGFSDLLFWDSTIVPGDVWDIVRLLASPHHIVGAAGRKRDAQDLTQSDSWCFSPITGWSSSAKMDKGAFPVAHVGTGMLRINRSVFEQLSDVHPEWQRNGHVRYFRWGDDGKDEIGEDVQFCRDWRAIGGKIYVDPSIAIHHYGDAAYSGRLMDSLIPA